VSKFEVDAEISPWGLRGGAIVVIELEQCGMILTPRRAISSIELCFGALL